MFIPDDRLIDPLSIWTWVPAYIIRWCKACLSDTSHSLHRLPTRTIIQGTPRHFEKHPNSLIIHGERYEYVRYRCERCFSVWNVDRRDVELWTPTDHMARVYFNPYPAGHPLRRKWKHPKDLTDERGRAIL